jgi:hypothetical protein
MLNGSNYQQFIEGLKYYFQFFQHLTTLDTGSLLLIATLLEKLFKSPKHTHLIKFCFTCFIISLIFSLFGMWFVSTMIAAKAGTGEGIAATVSFLVAVLGFLGGIIALAIFSVKNLK